MALMPSIISGSLIRDTPPSRRMSAGTRSSAITAHAPASSAILACSGVTTSMMTPPLSISAKPRLTGNEPVVPFETGDEPEPRGHGNKRTDATGRPGRGYAHHPDGVPVYVSVSAHTGLTC